MLTIEHALETNNRLSAVDKEILYLILTTNENKTSLYLSKKLKLSLATIQRRRKRLEKEFLEKEYIFCLEKFGWRRIDFFISTVSGKTDDVGRKILDFMQMIFVGMSVGEHTIDLRVETVVNYF